MEWKTYFLSTVHLRRWVRVDWSDTLPGELFILSKTKSSIEIKSNGFFRHQAKKSLNKMRLFFTHTNMIFSMGSDGKDKVKFYNSKTPSKGLSMILFIPNSFFSSPFFTKGEHRKRNSCKRARFPLQAKLALLHRH